MEEEHFLKKLGDEIRVRRGKKKITQLKLAELVGCSLQGMGNIERGQANPSVLMVYRIARALDVSVRELLP